MIGRKPVVALALALSVVAAAASATETAEVEVFLDVRGQDGGALPEEATVYAADPATREPLISWAAAPAQDRPVVLALPVQQAGWLLWARAPGWWGPARYVGAKERTATLVLAPQGVVRFALHAVDRAVDDLQPGGVWIDGRVHTGGQGLGRGVHGGPCEVDREQSRREVSIVCPFALGARADIRVRLGPFLPLLRSDLTVDVDADLGLVEPVRGAAVTGHLASVDAAARVLGLRQPRAPRTFPWSAWTDSSGIFRFEGLSPGNYELRLAGSSDSWPVRVESLSGSVDLGQLSSSAGTVLETTFGVPFGMESHRLRPVVRAVTFGAGDEVDSRGRRHGPDSRLSDGSFVWRGLPVGDYELEVADSQGNRWRREVFRFHGEDRRHVELDAVALVGRIEREGEALEDVMVWFGGLMGPERLSFRSGEEGRFEGLLPREGQWSVEVTPLPACDPCEGAWTDGWDGFEGSAVDDAGSVEVVADVDGVARVLIDLPAGRASGQVSWRRLESGAVEPVEGAYVMVRPESPWVGVEDDVLPPLHWTRLTDSLGRFEFSRLPEGVHFVQAVARLGEREHRSSEVRFRVTGRDSVEDLDLRLEPRQKLTVAVHSGGVPLAGAQTFVGVPASDSSLPSRRRTDGSGSAEHWLGATAIADVVVRAEGLGMVGWRFDVEAGAPVTIEMLPDRGTLRVPNGRLASLVTPGGVSIPVWVLEAMGDHGQVQSDDDDFVIRDLAPGTWTWCSSPGVCSAADVLPWAATSISE